MKPLENSSDSNGIVYFRFNVSNDEKIELTYFYGLLDEIRIFNRILDQAEIDELSNNQ